MPAERRAGRPSRRVGPGKAQRILVVGAGIDRRIVVEPEPVDGTADAFEVAGLQERLHQGHELPGIVAEQLRIGESAVPVGIEELSCRRIGGSRAGGAAGLHVVDCPHQRRGRRSPDGVDPFIT